MMGAELMKNLFDQRDALSDMIIEIKPRNEEERNQLRTLMQRRDGITGAINQIIAQKFNEVAEGLEDKISALKELTDRLNQLGRKIDQVQAAIQIADQTLKLISAILALAVSA